MRQRANRPEGSRQEAEGRRQKAAAKRQKAQFLLSLPPSPCLLLSANCSCAWLGALVFRRGGCGFWYFDGEAGVYPGSCAAYDVEDIFESSLF